MGDFALFLAKAGVPSGVTLLVAWNVVVVEAVLAVALLTGNGWAPAVPAAAAVSVGFVAVQARTWSSGRGRYACRCFGVLDVDDASIVPLLRATGLAAVLLVLLGFAPTGLPVNDGERLEPVVAGVLTGVGAVMVLALLAARGAFVRWGASVAQAGLVADDGAGARP